MSDYFLFELISPEKLFVSENATEAIIPGSEGYFSVMKEHCPFMSKMKAGLIEVHFKSGYTKKYHVDGGFIDVNKKKCIVLAENVEYDASKKN